jgi:hypothetical protein
VPGIGRGGAITGGWIKGAGPAEVLVAVSILSCFAFCPDNLLLRTPWEFEVLSGG